MLKNVFLLLGFLSFQRMGLTLTARHIDIKATDMSVKRSDIKYTGIAFIKYQLWFYPLKRSMIVNKTSF